MATPVYPKKVKGGRVTVLVGDGASPEVFTKVCGGTAKTFTIQKNTTDEFEEDCANPESVPVRVLQVTGIQWDMTLNAWYNRTQAALIRDLADDIDSRNFRFEIDEPPTEDIDAGTYQGKFLATNVQYNAGGQGEYMSMTISFASDGPVTWVDAA
jgi:hypothetical protein